MLEKSVSQLMKRTGLKDALTNSVSVAMRAKTGQLGSAVISMIGWPAANLFGARVTKLRIKAPIASVRHRRRRTRFRDVKR